MIMMNNNLRVFLTVADKKSFTETANELFITQPAVSKSIKHLEEELSLKLFHRDKRNGLILTDAGEKVLLLARQMADIENRIYQTAYTENNFLGGRVRIASLPNVTSVLLSNVIYDFRHKYPLVTLELMEGTPAEIKKAVEEHQVDFAVTASPFGDFDCEPLIKDRILAVNSGQLNIKEPVQLSTEPKRFILCDAGYITIIEMLSKQKVNLSESLIVKEPDTVVCLVEAGNGIGIISEFYMNSTSSKLHRYAISPSVEIEIGLVANDLSDLTPVALELKKMVENAAQIYISANKPHSNK